MKAVSFCIVALGLAIGAHATAKPRVTVGSKRFTESYVLAEMAAALLETGGAEARHVEGLGGTSIVFRALEEGSIDVYPDYTGTLAEAVLHLPSGAPRADLEAALASRGLALSPSLGFENRYALAVPLASPRTAGIAALSGLAGHGTLEYAISHEFLGRADGWAGLAAAYGLQATPRGVDHALAYAALARGAADVTDVYTTDAAIGRLGLRVLADDRHYFPPYDAVLVYRKAARERAPAAFEALDRLAGSLDAETMIRLNGEAEVAPRAFEPVARRLVAERFGGERPVAAPGPRSFLRELIDSVRRHGPRHLALVAAAVLAATAIGLPLGVLGHRRRRLGAVLSGVAGVVQTIPSLALLCFFIPIVGIGVAPSLAALFLYAIFPILQGTLLGLTGISGTLREAALVLDLRPTTRLFLVELPLAMRPILAGIKTSTVLAIGTATLAAFVGAGGFGEPISMGLNLNDTWLILEGAIPAALTALVAQGLFALLERAWVPRGVLLEEGRKTARR